MKYIFFQILILSISVNMIFAEENLTLDEAIKIGLKNNYSINIQKLNVKKSENSMSIATSGFLPSLDLSGRQNNTNNNVKQSFYDGREIERNGATSNSLEASIMAGWTIFDGFGMFIDYDLLKLYDDIAKLNLKKNIENLVQNIIVGYSELVVNKEAIKLNSDNLQISRYRYKIINDKKEAGKASGMDLLNAELDLNKDITDSIEINNNYLRAKSDFNQLIGRDSRTDFNPADSISLLNDFENYDLLINQLENNTELKLSNLGIEITQKDIEKLKSNYYPQINLFGGYSYSSLESQSGLLKSNVTNGLNYGITLSMNLFEGLKTNTLIENNKIDLEINKLSKEELTSFLNKELNNAVLNINKSKQVIKFNEENYTLTQKNLEIAREKLLTGTITQLEFREAQIKSIQSFNIILTEKLNQKRNETYLLKILGRLVN